MSAFFSHIESIIHGVGWWQGDECKDCNRKKTDFKDVLCIFIELSFHFSFFSSVVNHMHRIGGGGEYEKFKG